MRLLLPGYVDRPRVGSGAGTRPGGRGPAAQGVGGLIDSRGMPKHRDAFTNWCERVREEIPKKEIDLRVRAGLGLGMLARERGDMATARSWFQDAAGTERASPRWRRNASDLLTAVNLIQEQEDDFLLAEMKRKVALLQEEQTDLAVEIDERREELRRKDDLIRRLEASLRRSPGTPVGARARDDEVGIAKASDDGLDGWTEPRGNRKRSSATSWRATWREPVATGRPVATCMPPTKSKRFSRSILSIGKRWSSRIAVER